MSEYINHKSSLGKINPHKSSRITVTAHGHVPPSQEAATLHFGMRPQPGSRHLYLSAVQPNSTEYLKMVNICIETFWDLALATKLWQETSTQQKLVLSQTACTNLQTPCITLLWWCMCKVQLAKANTITPTVKTCHQPSKSLFPDDKG
jgi:hypothetical protein